MSEDDDPPHALWTAPINEALTRLGAAPAGLSAKEGEDATRLVNAADVGLSVDSAVDVAREAAVMVMTCNDLGALAVVAVAVGLPFTPLGAWFGFVPVSAARLAAPAAMTVAYLAVVEQVKRRFDAHHPLAAGRAAAQRLSSSR